MFFPQRARIIFFETDFLSEDRFSRRLAIFSLLLPRAPYGGGPSPSRFSQRSRQNTHLERREPFPVATFFVALSSGVPPFRPPTQSPSLFNLASGFFFSCNKVFPSGRVISSRGASIPSPSLPLAEPPAGHYECRSPKEKFSDEMIGLRVRSFRSDHLFLLFFASHRRSLLTPIFPGSPLSAEIVGPEASSLP